MFWDKTNSKIFVSKRGHGNETSDKYYSQNNIHFPCNPKDNFEKVRLDKEYIERYKLKGTLENNKDHKKDEFAQKKNEIITSLINNPNIEAEPTFNYPFNEKNQYTKNFDRPNRRVKGLSLSLISLSILTFLSYSIYKIDRNPNYNMLSLNSYGLLFEYSNTNSKKSHRPILITSSIKNGKTNDKNHSFLYNINNNKLISKGSEYYNAANAEINLFLESDLWVGRFQNLQQSLNEKTSTTDNYNNSWMSFINKKEAK